MNAQEVAAKRGWTWLGGQFFEDQFGNLIEWVPGIGWVE